VPKTLNIAPTSELKRWRTEVYYGGALEVVEKRLASKKKK